MTAHDTYEQFLDNKAVTMKPSGLSVCPAELSPRLFDFQRDITRWALARGRAALFENCGLGKTIQQLEWAHQIFVATGQDVLILAPLAVADQTVTEGAGFGYSVTLCRSQDDIRPGINITNYEMMHRFSAGRFGAVVLDESSILKSHDGKYRNMLIDAFADTPYKLACSATPAPNDYMEIGNHAEFLGIMSRVEMLAMFFTHDGGDTSKWRLKGHGEAAFYQWLASWAVMIQKPSDLGYDDGAFILPALNLHHHVIEATVESAWELGTLFPVEAIDLQGRQRARKASTGQRVQAVAAMVDASDEPWVLWCNLNDEADQLERAIPGAVQIAGRDKPEHKEGAMKAFSAGEIRVLVTKPSIAGYGMNWQHCANVAFVGLSDSWEDYYQAIRRCWRFGQTQEVNCHIVTAETEGAVVANINRKETQAAAMQDAMVDHMKLISQSEIRTTQAARDVATYARETAEGEGWAMHLGDCVEVVKDVPTDSVGYTIFSPPFASLYTYSNSDRDMGNCKNSEEFARHFDFLVGHLYRVTMPGRLLSFHCFNLPLMKERDGVIGLRDFRGEMIRMFEAHGWIFHSEVCIWKDPVTAMQRTKALGLLHKTIRKDSAMSRQGIPDYLVTMRKPGANTVPISHTPEEFPVSLWQRYASPVWMDIRPNRTLQKESAREQQDERHICPLQLDVIERGIELWSAPGDTVLSPFAGIGSEGHVALQKGRRFIGAELKRSYWECAVRNLQNTQSAGMGSHLFSTT